MKRTRTGRLMPRVTTGQIYWGAVPFVLIQVVMVALVISFPQMVMVYKGKESKEPGVAEIIVAKQRNGPTDKVKFVFRSRLTRFEEAAPDAFSQFSGVDEI